MTRSTIAKSSARAALALGIVAVAAKLSIVGCSDAGSYIFSGEQYDPTLQCLEPVSSIDVIAGNPPGSCGPVCFLSLPEDGGQLAYVSTMCGPYPSYPYELDAGTSPLCIAAMNAFARGALCEDGGVVITGDAGTDGGSASDAASSDGASPGDSGGSVADSGAAVDAGVDAGEAPTDAGSDGSGPADAAAD